MKIAYVMSRFPKVTETFVLYEMLALRRRGFEVEVFPLLRERGEVQHPETESLLPYVHGDRLLSWGIAGANWSALWRSPLRYLRLLTRVAGATMGSANHFFGALAIFPKAVYFAREMEALGIEHVHAHFANHPALCGWIVGQWTGIPFSFTAHGSDLHVDQRGLELKIGGAAFVVMISRYNVEFLRGHLGPECVAKTELIHCGTDPDVFRPGPPGGERSWLQVLCVASLRPVKGHAVLVEACRILAERGVAIRCDLIGEGPERRAIEDRVARSGLQGSVVLHGSRPRPEVVEWLQRSDVAVLASVTDTAGRREGIPVSLMEAMACGVPVVASRLSGIPELVEDPRSGLLFPPGDAGALASALEELAASPELRARMGKAARERVVADFDLETNTARLASLFEAHARTEGPGPP